MKEYLIEALGMKKDYNPEGKCLSFIYFHGNLQDEIGYDLINVVGDNLYKKINNITEKGIIKTYVKIDEIFKPVIMHIWKTSTGIKGLVSLIDDTKSIKDAIAKQEVMTEYL